MNKTYPINISGIVFYINEDAYRLLENYLNTIKQYYLKTEDGAEIISDIESRIAELFSEKVSSSKQIITKQEVEEVIQKLGRPEDFDEEESDNEPKFNNPSSKPNKKFYRDTDEGVIAGIAAGLSHYFGVDVVFVRILFILLVIGGTIGFWVYLILWIISPEAKSTIEKLEMKGEPVNLSNMEKKIREEFENVKTSFKDKKTSQKVNTFFGKFFSLIKQIILGIFSILKSIFGFSFLLIGVVLLSIIASYFIFDSTIISLVNNQWTRLPIQDILTHFTNEKQSSTLLISLLGIIIIPVVSLTYAGIKLIFRFKFQSKAFGIISFILFLFSAIIFSLSIADIAKEYKVRKSKSYTIDTQQDTQLFIKIKNNGPSLLNDNIFFTDYDNDVIITKEEMFVKIETEIYESTDSVFHIKVKKSSIGKNKQDAKVNIEKINFNIDIQNDSLFLDLYSVTKDKYKGEEVEIQIFRPKDGKILIQKEEFISDYEGSNSLEDIILDK